MAEMREALSALRNEMQANGIDAWIVPTTDFHGSEYVNDYFKCREYLSGFTGSAGTLAVTQDAAALWTDGRYFLQAETQLAGSGITLMREGIEGVPQLPAWLKAHLPAEGTGRTVGFDGRVVDLKLGRELAASFPLRWELDLSDQVWAQRPPLAASAIYALPWEVTGESAASKLGRIRRAMREAGADYHLITSLEEIAWIWNLRASDVTHTPVFYAFMLLTPQETRVYLLNETQEAAALFRAALQEETADCAQTLSDVMTDGSECAGSAAAEDGAHSCAAEDAGAAGVCACGENLRVLPYFDIFEDLKQLPPGRILLDEKLVSYGIAVSVPEQVEKIAAQDPAMLMKAIKNETEIAATRRAHVRDGAAMVRFLYWLKQEMQARQAGTEAAPITEMSAAARLAQERRREGAYDLSFDTIAGYGPHGAIVHYESTPETDVALAPEGFLLVDSGGQYRDGTTDITRTVALGPLTDKMKRCYTAVLKGHIVLASARFDAETTGEELDQRTREPLRAQGLDYLHGTGHGVGHLLSVHEGPQTISPRGKDCHVLPGMISSDEPGVYLEGEFGVRLENEILCREAQAKTDGEEKALRSGADAKAQAGTAEQNESHAGCSAGASGRTFCFETITFCPFEREAILTEQLTEAERAWVNRYHQQVYETIAPLLDEETRAWLAAQTAPL